MIKHRFVCIAATLIAASLAWQPASAQADAKTQQAFALYQQVTSGARTLESLSPQERDQVLRVARLLSPSCSSDSEKCRAACEAANQLDSAAHDLARCASQHDYSDSCDRQFRDVRDAHDDLENAISEASGDCG